MGFAICCPCFGPSKEQRREEDRLASEARARAAEAAQKRQEQFEKSATGRAARAQLEAEKSSRITLIKENQFSSGKWGKVITSVPVPV